MPFELLHRRGWCGGGEAVGRAVPAAAGAAVITTGVKRRGEEAGAAACGAGAKRVRHEASCSEESDADDGRCLKQRLQFVVASAMPWSMGLSPLAGVVLDKMRVSRGASPWVCSSKVLELKAKSYATRAEAEAVPIAALAARGLPSRTLLRRGYSTIREALALRAAELCVSGNSGAGGGNNDAAMRDDVVADVANGLDGGGDQESLPYHPCSACPKAFATPQFLAAHMQRRHPPPSL